MMEKREIEFRGKDKINGNWVYGDLHLRCFHPHIHTDCMNKVFIDIETIGQYTGLKDKKYKEIYEGDIVKNDGYEELCVVEYEHGQYIGRYKGDSYIGLGFYVYDRNSIEVVGNIYDDKKLLKGN